MTTTPSFCSLLVTLSFVFLKNYSQRLGELFQTVLSRYNIILLRIRNNVDLEQIRKSIPYLNDM